MTINYQQHTRIMAEYAPSVYRALNGVFCIYKPLGFNMKAAIKSLQVKLATELNGMKVRPVRERVLVHAENLNTDLPLTTIVSNLSDHPLVLGPRYLHTDFAVNYVHGLDKDSTGVIVMAIGDGRKYLKHIARCRYIRTYHVKGQLGMATQDFTPSGKLIKQMTFDHVTHGKLDRVVAAMQASHQKFMFQATGVNAHSEEAYEIASHGLIRPDIKQAGPVVYGMKCIHFNPPEFILEIHCVNEDGTFLRRLIHLLALEMKTGAICTQVRRIRYGRFNLSHALLQKHWKSVYIRENIEHCSDLVDWNAMKDYMISKGINTETVEEQNDENVEIK